MRSFLAVAASLGLVAALPAPARDIAAHPGLWKLADADTTIYLFGTVHILPDKFRWRDAAIDRALAASDSLTLELVLDRDPGAVADSLMTLGRAAGLPPLAERVPAAKRAALAALVRDSGLSSQLLDGMKSWAAGVILIGAAMKQAGLATSADSGVEPQLTAQFRAAGKPIDGLETAAQQLGFFDALPEPAQRAFLLATLDDPAKARAEFDRMVAAWARGDVAAIERSFATDPEFTPALRDVLVRRRDQAWATVLARRLDRPGTSFVAVGAGHLAGPDSVQHMLALKGYKVIRVQ